MTETSTQTVLAPAKSRDSRPLAHGISSSIPLNVLGDPGILSEDTSALGTGTEDASVASADVVGRPARVSRLQQTLVIFLLCGVTLTASVVNGLVIVSLPAMTKDLQLPPSLAFWPASVSGLATASTLLLAGSVADAVGPRWVELVGCFTSGALMMGGAASRGGQQLVAMRALQGVGLSLHLAASVAIVTQSVPPGRGRNMAFSCLGLAQPLGFSLGLVLGGVLVDTIGWRAGWYLTGGMTLAFGVVGMFALPENRVVRDFATVLNDVGAKIDWVGAALASTFMALLCYLLA